MLMNCILNEVYQSSEERTAIDTTVYLCRTMNAFHQMKSSLRELFLHLSSVLRLNCVGFSLCNSGCLRFLHSCRQADQGVGRVRRQVREDDSRPQAGGLGRGLGIGQSPACLRVRRQNTQNLGAQLGTRGVETIVCPRETPAA